MAIAAAAHRKIVTKVAIMIGVLPRCFVIPGHVDSLWITCG